MGIQYEHAYLRAEFASTVMTIKPILILHETAPLELTVPVWHNALSSNSAGAEN